MSKTPKSDEFIKKQFPVFVEALSERLSAGKESYGDNSFNRESFELITEIQQELIDVSGWSALMWGRLEKIKEALK